MNRQELVRLLKLPVDNSLLEALGFTEYDDEHCTWGNRRLMVHDSGQWPNGCYKLQIIEYGDYPADNDPEYNDCFYYAGWFEILDRWRTKDGWHLKTLKDIYKIIYLYHREYLDEFKQKISLLQAVS